MGILDFIFPKRCVNCKKQADYICANCLSFISFDAKTLKIAGANKVFGLTLARD